MKIIQLRFVVLFVLLATPVCAADLSQTSVKDFTESIVSGKILGGVESKSGDWPWVVALLYSDVQDIYQAQYCSGVLIGESWILTAAHCVQNRTAGSIDVAIGAFDLSSFSGSRSKVSYIQVHPQYNSDLLQYDIALLRLSTPSSQPKIALFAGDSVESVPSSLLGEMTTAIGWGMADGSSWPEKLRQVNLPVVNNSLCNSAYSTSLIASQLCAGYGYYEGKDVCSGDSGGPIMSYIDGEWLHVGLVSYGSSCQDYGGWYGVYTRTSEFVDYIKLYVPDVSIHIPSSGNRAGSVSGLLLLLLKK